MKKKTSTRIFLIQEAYRQLVISGELRWSGEKAKQMCSDLGMETDELRALLRMKSGEFNKHILKKEEIGKQYSLLLMQIAVTRGYCNATSPKTL